MKTKKFPVTVIVVSLIFSILPLVSVFISSWLADRLGCRVDESQAKGCILFGVDLSDLLYSMFVAGWLSLITYPDRRFYRHAEPDLADRLCNQVLIRLKGNGMTAFQTGVGI